MTRMTMTRPFLPLTAALLLASATPCLADKRVDEAIDKAIKYIDSKQDRSARKKRGFGAFRERWSDAYPAGETALSLLALLKAGVHPNHPSVVAGFEEMYRLPIKKVYSVSIGILAIEARYAPPKDQVLGKSYATVARKRFKRAVSPADKAWLIKATKFLVQHQKGSGMWAYPHADQDVSNTQFALLALKTSCRLGLRKLVPQSIWINSLKYLVERQEMKGPKIAPFSVPAADKAIRSIDKKSDRKARKKRRARRRDDGGTREREGREGIETVEKVDFFARGWGYKPGEPPRGSMTAAGLACLVVIKSELEDHRGYQKTYAAKVDQAIRDGAAWLALRFRPDANPGADKDWLFYYLYTVERAGTLTAVDLFGTKDWYAEGREKVLASQQPDGSFEVKTGGEHDGVLAGTCFAVLFLKRSTVPVIEREATGSDIGGPAQAGKTEWKRLDDGRYSVTFRFKPTILGQVSVAGSFNGWNKDADRLEDPDGDGVFEATLTIDGGEHGYKFVINGHQWELDPGNPARRDDGRGNENSLLALR